jgi:hypothetical protein
MAVFKNVASQKLAVFAWDTTADTEKTGDAANITGYISKDAAAMSATNDVNPTELDATNAPGVYIFDATQAETNANMLVLFAKSSTANIKLDPMIVYTMAVGVGNRVAVDAEAVSGSTTAADNVEANIANLDAAVSTRSTFNAASDSVDAAKISGSATAADNVEANIANLDAAVSTRSTFNAASDSVDAAKISGSTTAADNVEANIANLDAAVSSRSTLSAADVNTEVADVLRTDAMAELAQGIPPATPTMEEAVMLLYMAVRNKLTVTAIEKGIYNDAGTKITKKTLADDGTTYTESEAVSGA